jgi:hypothetical protein
VRLASTLAAIGLVAFGAGCGGDDNGGGRLSQDEFQTQANAICKEFEAKVEALPEPQNAAELADYADQAKEIFAEGLGRLRDLQPPEDAQADYDAFLDNGEKAAGRLDELVEAARTGDEAALNRVVEQADKEDAEADRMAQRVGLTDCAND